MQIKTVKIESVFQDPKNKRLHNDVQYLALRESLQRFGQQIPIVVDVHNKIIKGNGTWQVAKELGWDKIVVHVTTLTGTEADMFSITDNRIAEMSEWDYEQLSIAMQENGDMSDQLLKLGWTDQMLKPLRIAKWEPEKLESLEPPPKNQFLEPSIFLDFDGDAMAHIAAAVSHYRAHHPSAEQQPDAYCVGKICAKYAKLPKELT